METKDPIEIDWCFCVGLQGARTRGRCKRFPTVLCPRHNVYDWEGIKAHAKLPHSDYLPELIEPNGRYCSICRFILGGEAPAKQ